MLYKNTGTFCETFYTKFNIRVRRTESLWFKIILIFIMKVLKVLSVIGLRKLDRNEHII